MARIRDREATFEVPDGEVFIHLAGNPAVVWDMTANSTLAGGRTVLWRRHGGANQRWRVTVFDDTNHYYTYFRIINVHSGMALVHQAAGDAIVQQPLAEAGSEEGWSQVWSIGFPGFNGASGSPARPAQPHPTGSDGARLYFKGTGPYKPVVAAPEAAGTNLSTTQRYGDFEDGWKFTAAP